MRILHTADWHLGQSLRGYSRDREHAAVLRHLVTLVEQHQPNALIIAGDVFDSPNPSAEAQTLFFKTLVGLNRACPTMTTVITAGNHDAATRLEAPRALLAAIRVHVVGNVRRLNGQTLKQGHLVPVPSEHGNLLGHILAVSYPTAACLPAVPGISGTSQLVAAVQQLYTDLVSQTKAEWEGRPLVLTGHLHVAGATESEGSERSILIGGENAIPAAKFPGESNYVALGHLHKAQAAGAPHIRYSGSLIPMSASEIDYDHGVTLVEIDAGETRTTHLPLPRPVAFHRLPSKGSAKQNELEGLFAALDASKDTSPDQRPYVYIRLSRQGLSPAFREEIDQKAEDHGLRVLEIRLEEPALSKTDATVQEQSGPAATISDHQPDHFFRLAFDRAHQKPPEPPHLLIFQQALEEATAS